MRAYHVVTVIFVFVFAFAIKHITLPRVRADADASSITMDVLSMHTTSAYRQMKVERTHDMENVFVEDN